jgi:hypothetical protein
MIQLYGGGVRRASWDVTSPFSTGKFSGMYLVEATELDNPQLPGKGSIQRTVLSVRQGGIEWPHM